MREVVFDTETTGLDKNEDRIIEIGCVELENRFLTGRTYHTYINPQGRSVHPDALAIHGISDNQLSDKLFFSEIVDDFLSFVGEAVLVAHNAMFDLRFINAELMRVGYSLIQAERVVDTLALARRKHPMGPNSLDALCRRYGIDNSRRVLHGALLDSEILADIYVEMTGGRQRSFTLVSSFQNFEFDKNKEEKIQDKSKKRAHILPRRLKPEEQDAHFKFLQGFEKKALWFAQ